MPRVEAIETLVRGLDKAPDNPSLSIQVHFSKRLESYIQNEDSITILFQDGSKASANILIGADGIGSRTRQTMYRTLADDVRDTDPGLAAQFEKGVPPTFTGTYQYRATLDIAHLREINPTNIALGALSVVS